MINLIDIFSWCWWLSLWFKKAWYNLVFANDIDINCEKTYKKNFPNADFICNDIWNLWNDYLIKKTNWKQIDIIIWWPPCQGFSLANKNRNKVKNDPRNKLFFQFVRMVNLFKPKIFLMENVKWLLSTKKWQAIKEIIKEFEKAGNWYNVEYKVLKAADFWVPQLRERVFILWVDKSIWKNVTFPNPILSENNYISVFDAISDLPKINAWEWKEIQSYVTEPKNKYQEKMREKSKKIYNHISMNHTKRLIERFKVIKHDQSLKDVPKEHLAVKRWNPKEISNIIFSQNNKRVHPNKPSPTIAASFQSNFIHPYLNRNFTAREWARIQSFPDDFIFEWFRTKMSWEIWLSQYQQIGNAVSPILSNEIAKHIKKIYFK